MKKYLFFLALAISFTISAQDTIVGSAPKDNYLIMHNWWVGADTLCPYGYLQLNDGRGDQARYFYTSDTLTIYGIAGALISSDYYWRAIGCAQDLEADLPLDTSHDLTEALRLYKYNESGTSLVQIGEDLLVNLEKTPITYYQQLTQICLAYPHNPVPAFPVYERYFSSPKFVVDTFFVGCTQHNVYEGDPAERWSVGIVPLGPVDTVCRDMMEAVQSRVQLPDGTDGYEWILNIPTFTDWFLFPILTPYSNGNPDDTTGHGGGGIDTTGVDTTRHDDTLSMVRHDMMERMVAVTPNPARTQVKVACGMGLTLVEVFDASSKQVLSEKATGMVHRIDVAGWPQGVYAVVIHTPLGKVTKKLLVE